MIKQSIAALACVVLLAGCGGGGGGDDSTPSNTSPGADPPPPGGSDPDDTSPITQDPEPGTPPVVSDDPPKAPAGMPNPTMGLFDAYQQTVHPVMNQNCGACHNVNDQDVIDGVITAHSDGNPQTAFNVIFGPNGDGRNGSWVADPINPQGSLAVTRPDPGMHECGGQAACVALSDNIEAAIVNMAERTGLGGPAAINTYRGAKLRTPYNFSFQGVRNPDGTMLIPAVAEKVVRGDFASLASPANAPAQQVIVYSAQLDRVDDVLPDRLEPGPLEEVSGVIFGGADANAVTVFNPLPVLQNVSWGQSLTMVEANLGVAYEAVQQVGNITEFVIFYPERHIVIAFTGGHVQYYGIYNPFVVTAENRIEFLVAAKIDVLNMGNSQ